jgi:hypothetical protein
MAPALLSRLSAAAPALGRSGSRAVRREDARRRLSAESRSRRAAAVNLYLTRIFGAARRRCRVADFRHRLQLAPAAQQLVGGSARCCGSVAVGALAAQMRGRQSAETRSCGGAGLLFSHLSAAPTGDPRRPRPLASGTGELGPASGLETHTGLVLSPARLVAQPNAKVQPHAAPTQLSDARHPGAACRLQRNVRPKPRPHWAWRY